MTQRAVEESLGIIFLSVVSDCRCREGRKSVQLVMMSVLEIERWERLRGCAEHGVAADGNVQQVAARLRMGGDDKRREPLKK